MWHCFTHPRHGIKLRFHIGKFPSMWEESARNIPHICHFFYTGRNFEYKYFTPANYKKTHPKIITNSRLAPKSVNDAIFAFNLENFTPDRIFLHRHRLWCLWQIWGMARKCKPSQKCSSMSLPKPTHYKLFLTLEISLLVSGIAHLST